MSVPSRDFIRRLALARPPLTQLHRTWREAGNRYRFRDIGACAVILHDYSGRMILNGEPHEIRPGSLSCIPRGMDRVFLPDSSGWHRVVNYSPDAFDAPLVTSIDLSYQRIRDRFDECLAVYAVERSRAELGAWELLWDLHESVDWFPNINRLPPLIEEAVKMIEWNLSERLSIVEIASRVHVSPEHFARLFTRSMGISPSDYQRGRRMLLARYLLENTDQRMKEIASACGMNDAQWFNKTVRKTFGCSPSELRRRRSASSILTMISFS